MTPRVLVKIAVVFLVLGQIAASAGCSFVNRDYFFSPGAEGGVRTRERTTEHPVMITGPADHLEVASELVRVQVSVWEHGYQPVAIGPFYFPVIPIFWFWMTAPYEDPRFQDDEITIVMKVSPAAAGVEGLRVDPDEVTLYLPDEDQHLRPASKSERYGQFRISYRVPRSGLEVFELNLDGIEAGGRKVSLPKVTFVEASGWMWGLAP